MTHLLTHQQWSSRPRRATLLAALVACLLMLAPTTAFAQDSSIEGYGGEGGNALSTVNQGDADDDSAAAAAAGGSSGDAKSSGDANVGPGALPFTGQDVGLMLLGSLVLIGAGAALARATRPSEQ